MNYMALYLNSGYALSDKENRIEKPDFADSSEFELLFTEKLYRTCIFLL